MLCQAQVTRSIILHKFQPRHIFVFIFVCLYFCANCTSQPKTLPFQTKLTNVDVSDSNRSCPEANRSVTLLFFQPPSHPLAAALHQAILAQVNWLSTLNHCIQSCICTGEKLLAGSISLIHRTLVPVRIFYQSTSHLLPKEQLWSLEGWRIYATSHFWPFFAMTKNDMTRNMLCH